MGSRSSRGEKAKVKYARLKPYSEKQRHLLRRLTFLGFKFIGSERGNKPTWYSVPEDICEDLAEINQTPNDPDTPKAFDIVNTEAEKNKIERNEDERAIARAPSRTRSMVPAKASGSEGSE